MQHARIISDGASLDAYVGRVCATFTLLIRSRPKADNARSTLQANYCCRWRALRSRCDHAPERTQDYFRLAARRPRRVLYWGIAAYGPAESRGATIGICPALFPYFAGRDRRSLTHILPLYSDAPALPAALVDRRKLRVLHRARPRKAGAGVCLCVSPERPSGPSQFFVAGVGDFFSSSSSCFSSAGRLATSRQSARSLAASF